MTLADVEAAAALDQLEIFGLLGANAQNRPAGIETLVLLGPREPGFWAHFSVSTEFKDGAPHPLDRWSKRVIGALAEDLGATPFFPFTGPPFHPFFQWATESGEAWASPVSLLVHHRAGLMVSYRGALGFETPLDTQSAPAMRPCTTCAGQPCTSTCPVDALSAKGYDVDACQAHLKTPAGRDCLERGCRIRRTCPVSVSYGRLPEQSAFHMAAFHK